MSKNPKHITHSQQFNQDFLDSLFDRATKHKNTIEAGGAPKRTLQDKYLVSLFYEPSTRTRFSFELAAQRLGMHVIETENASQFSSAAKGETLEDSIEVIDRYYPDVIVLRHKDEGAAERAAKVSRASILNAGDGAGQHPTQALLDLFTIQNKLGKTDGLNIVAGGDLKNGRTIRSLAYLLARYPGNKFFFISPKSQQMSEDIKKYLNDNKIEFVEDEKPDEYLPDADVVYWTRTQRERGSEDGQEIVLDKKLVKAMKDSAIVMHPLPRVDEITTDVDELPQATYFEQAGNGLFVRMAILEHVLGVV